MDDEDEVEVLGIDCKPIEVACEICGVSLSSKSVSARQAHYERHFDRDERESQAGPSEFIDLSSSPDSMRVGSPFTISKSKKSEKDAEKISLPSLDKRNIFWHRSHATRPPPNFTPGLISLLRQALMKSHAKGQTVRAALCYEGAVHVGSERWDIGWGCGYRNFLMACTALMDQQVQPLYFPALDQPPPPGVLNLQQWIEDAWRAGFDAEGANDLKHKLVGTSKWIGTAELYVAFLFRGIPSRLVDFPHVSQSADAVVQWIVTYFTEASRDAQQLRLQAGVKTTVEEALRGASPVMLTDRMPLVLQHKGHSRTIVGFERTKDGSVNLLCFDPSRRPSSSIRNAAIDQFMLSRPQHYSTDREAESSHRCRISPAEIINTMLHPRTHSRKDKSPNNRESSRKRRSDEDVRPGMKRVRGGLHVPGDSNLQVREVIEILDDGDNEGDEEQSPSSSKPIIKDTPDKVDHSRVLELFRLRPKKVGKKDRYQILYFPLEDVLTEQERWARRVVTSEVVQ